MKHHRFLSTALALIVALSVMGCARQIQEARDFVSTVTSTSVTPRDAYIAINGFDAVEATATNYLRLPRCNGSRPLCRSPAATPEIIRGIRAGRVARNDVKSYLRAHPGQNLAIRSYDDLIAAKDSLISVINKYKSS